MEEKKVVEEVPDEVIELTVEELAEVSGGYHILNDGVTRDPHVVNN